MSEVDFKIMDQAEFKREYMKGYNAYRYARLVDETKTYTAAFTEGLLEAWRNVGPLTKCSDCLAPGPKFFVIMDDLWSSIRGGRYPLYFLH
jgi:hypothetical protein